jgi:hypothetical protein
MLGVALAALVVGIVMTFFLSWVGIPMGVVGLALLIAFLAGWGPPRDPRPPAARAGPSSAGLPLHSPP